MTDFIQKNHLEKVVLLAGEQDNINDWLNMSDVFILVSKEESLPLSLLEAVQVGKPCLVSRVGDMPLWIEQGKNGFVCPSGWETLISCFIAELAEKPDLRRKMAKNMTKTASRIKDSSEQYQYFYQQIMEGSFHVKTCVSKKKRK